MKIRRDLWLVEVVVGEPPHNGYVVTRIMTEKPSQETLIDMVTDIVNRVGMMGHSIRISVRSVPTEIEIEIDKEQQLQLKDS